MKIELTVEEFNYLLNKKAIEGESFITDTQKYSGVLKLEPNSTNEFRQWSYCGGLSDLVLRNQYKTTTESELGATE